MIISSEIIDQDEEIILKAKKSPDAFKPLYERYFKKIFQFVFNRIRDKEITADLVSQIFLKALNNINRFQYNGIPFSAWLYRIAINEVNLYYRKNKIRHITLDQSMIDGIREEAYGNDKERLFEILEKILPTLNNEELELLELRFFEKKNYNEIAYILNISESNARIKLWRILEKLRKEISNLE